ncbi:5572_t:CDS:2, partial [Scutellospora calospora]
MGSSQNTITDYHKFLRELVIDTLKDVSFISGIEKTKERKIFLKIVEKQDKETIKEVIEKYVERGLIIYTDSWEGYLDIDKLGVTHETVNYSKNFTDSMTDAHTNSIE